MDLRNNRYSQGYRTWDDGLEATVLIGAFLTLVIVASALFYGAPWVSTATTAGLDEKPVMKAKVTVPPRSFPSTPPAYPVPTAVPALAEQVIQPTPAPNLVAIPASTPTPVQSSPTPVSRAVLVGQVANTGGDGVFLRHTPLLADRWMAWPDRTPLVFLGNEAEGDGQHWVQVRDPKNNIGWVPSQYVIRLGG
jgi:hypothetical protein